MSYCENRNGIYCKLFTERAICGIIDTKDNSQWKYVKEYTKD